MLAEDMTGRRYGKLLVISRSGNIARSPAWLVRCDCGTEKRVLASNMRAGKTRSCGCSAGATRHGHVLGREKSPTWRSWASMKSRCLNSRAHEFPLYGGRGITVCARWMVFEAFLEDMGFRPSGTSLDRIDVNGNYEPGNVRWATAAVQGRNKRTTKLEEHEPAQIVWLSQCGYRLSDVARFFGVSRPFVYNVVRGTKYDTLTAAARNA